MTNSPPNKSNHSGAQGTFSLMKKRYFLPYFITQFLGAFNDNIFKNSLLIIVAFSGADSLAISTNLFINLAAGLFILPFFLFSATAGELADKYPKDWFIRTTKTVEVLIMLCAAIGFVTHSYQVLLLLLFLMGTQSAFFGPVKYALLPQQLSSEQLVSGNALVEMGTFLAILFGTIGAGFITSSPNANYLVAALVLLFALLGRLSSQFIPKVKPANPDAKVRWQPLLQTGKTLSIAKKDKTILQAVIGISWFWFLGACYLTQFPNFTQLYLKGNESSVSFLLALFSIGIAFGSLLCARLTKLRPHYPLVLIGSIGITLSSSLFAFSVPEVPTATTRFIEFINQPSLWPLFLFLLMLGSSGGVFIVPLYTRLQQRADPAQCAQVIAANNIFNALFMVASAIVGIVALSLLKLTIPQLFMFLSLLSLLFTLYLFNLNSKYKETKPRQ